MLTVVTCGFQDRSVPSAEYRAVIHTLWHTGGTDQRHRSAHTGKLKKVATRSHHCPLQSAFYTLSFLSVCFLIAWNPALSPQERAEATGRTMQGSLHGSFPSLLGPRLRSSSLVCTLMCLVNHSTRITYFYLQSIQKRTLKKYFFSILLFQIHSICYI